MVVLAMALTGGRTGMATWALIAIAFGVLKWRKLLILAPIAATLVVAFVPAVQDRLLEGFTDETIDTNASIEQHQFPEGDGPDMYTVTAGRTFAWPFVIEEIAGAPVLGYGREGMKRTGLTLFLLAEYGESFPHPHNMYLQWLLDNGVIGFIPVLLFYLFIGYVSMKLFLDKEDSNAVVIGGVSISLLLALLIAGVGSQTFYPREGAVGMWCAFGLALRVYVQQKYAVRATQKEKKQGKANFWGIARVRRAPRRSVYG
jgi:O-antigen ligase